MKPKTMKKLILFSLSTLSYFITVNVSARIIPTITSGTTPVCTSGTLNLVVINKDVGGCNGSGDGNFCVVDSEVSYKPYRAVMPCDNVYSMLSDHTNESISLPKGVKTVSIKHHIFDGGNGNQLVFSYNHGAVSDNCAAVFGDEAKCTVTKSGDDQHTTYTWTIESTKPFNLIYP